MSAPRESGAAAPGRGGPATEVQRQPPFPEKEPRLPDEGGGAGGDPYGT
jgi:hypothetical protein